MIIPQVKTQFDDTIRELNYNDFSLRFPKILEFYRLLHEYDDAPPYYVPTDGSQIYPGTRYKQKNVYVDLRGSWRHVLDAFYPVRQTIEELLMYFDQRVKNGDAKLTPHVIADIGQNPGYYYNSDNYYLNYFNNVGFPYRGEGFTEDSMKVLFRLEVVIKMSMQAYTEANGKNFDDITKQLAKDALLAKSVSSLTAQDLYKLFDYYLEDRGIQLPSRQ
jgi:hypothetical protein